MDEQLIFEMGYNKGFKDGIKGSVPMSVLEDIKAEIYKILDECEPACETQNNFDGGLTVALEIIDKHMSGKELPE